MNTALVLAFPIFLSGLGVAHAAAGRTRYRFGLLFGLYAVLLMTRWAPILMVLVGLVDHFVGLKARLLGRSTSV